VRGRNASIGSEIVAFAMFDREASDVLGRQGSAVFGRDASPVCRRLFLWLSGVSGVAKKRELEPADGSAVAGRCCSIGRKTDEMDVRRGAKLSVPMAGAAVDGLMGPSVGRGMMCASLKMSALREKVPKEGRLVSLDDRVWSDVCSFDRFLLEEDSE
jgi:hypothetical protein